MSRKGRKAAVQPYEMRDSEGTEETPPRHKSVSPLNAEQAELMKLINRNDIVFLRGKAGSGKSAVCIGMAAEYLNRNLIDRIIISRPVIASEDFGYLKGEIESKINPYVEVLFFELSKYINVKQAIAQNKLLVLPVAFMRSWTFNNAFVIVSEAENLTCHQFKLILTRLGKNSKMILEGDASQSDLDSKHNKDFDKVIKKMEEVARNPENRVAIFELQKSVRNPLIEVLLKAFEEGV